MLNITDHRSISLDDADSINHAIFFCGEAIDDRGRAILSVIQNEPSNLIIKVYFDVSRYVVILNGVEYPVLKANTVISALIEANDGNQFYLDATTVGFVELLLVLRWFSRSKFCTLSVFYAEPLRYKSRIDYMNDFGKHEFDLTSYSAGFKAVPGFSKALSTDDKATLVAVLGFERSRLGQLIQSDEGAYIGNILPIFGTPGFKVGWDKHSFLQSVDTLKDRSGKPQFVTAYSAIDIFNCLERIKISLPNETIMVAPFSTKPLSLGVVVFLVNNSEDVILKYDHPTKKSDSSEGVGKIHEYTVTRG